MNRLAGENRLINILRGKINSLKIYFPCSLFMSLPQIYSYSPALSLLPPSLGSRASKYRFWVVHSGYRVAEVWARLPASCQLGIRHGAASAVAQDPGPGFQPRIRSLPPAWPWASRLVSLPLKFPIYQIEGNKILLWVCFREMSWCVSKVKSAVEMRETARPLTESEDTGVRWVRWNPASTLISQKASMSPFTSLSLGFFICKIGIMTPTLESCFNIRKEIGGLAYGR